MQSIDADYLLIAAFVAGFLLSVLLIVVAKLLKKRDVYADIEFLQFERDYRDQILRSKEILYKNTRRSIFFCLFLLGVAVLASFFIKAVYTLPDLPDLLPEKIVIGEAVSGVQERVDPYGTESGRYPAVVGTHGAFVHYLPLGLWFVYTFFAFLRYRRFSDVNTYMKAINDIDDKLVKLQKRAAG